VFVHSGGIRIKDEKHEKKLPEVCPLLPPDLIHIPHSPSSGQPCQSAPL